MQLLDEHNAVDYLRRRGWIGLAEPVEIEALPGGVSNQVLYVSRSAHPERNFVLKQVRAQLRVADPWFSRIDRIWREVEVLRVCQELLSHNADGSLRVALPTILHEDREEYAFAMTAAPRAHHVWKRELLAGHVDGEIARQCGRLLGQLHARSWHNESVAIRLHDQSIFDELRLDPYYRTVAARHPHAAAWLQELIDSSHEQRHALVHADFSPKNLLLADETLMMVDFETGHYGDPAFDLGFFLSHLVLKAVQCAPQHKPYLELSRAFWRGYRADLWPRIPAVESAALEARGIRHFAGCFWARVDGKSPVEYLTALDRRDYVRTVAQAIFADPPTTWNDLLERLPPMKFDL